MPPAAGSLALAGPARRTPSRAPREGALLPLGLALALLPLAALLGACATVEKTLVIDSDPPGAQVRLDGRVVGTTPYRAPFDSWGTRGLVLEKEGYRLRRESLPIDRPWWQATPLDLFFEVFYPGTIRVARAFSFPLEPLPPQRGSHRDEAHALYARLRAQWAEVVAAEAQAAAAAAGGEADAP